MSRHFVRLCGTALALSALAACGDDSTTPLPGPGGGGSGRVVKANPSFQSDIVEIFNRRGCTASGCHGAAPGAGNLHLESSVAFAQLVGVNSDNEPDFERVKIGDATNSYLVIKLEGRQTEGVRMPRGESPLNNTDLSNIKNWINTGAPNN